MPASAPDGQNAQADAPQSDRAAGDDAGASSFTLEQLLPEDLYAALFPNHDALYDYAALIRVAARYPEFVALGSENDRRRELAAFLAQIAHETTGGWATAPGGPEAWGLYFTQEVGCQTGSCTQYCDATQLAYPCRPGKTYHGRGPIQLSWNFNYGAFGSALGLDLLEDPDLVLSDPEIAFETALWFWMTPQTPKPSAHAALLGLWQPSDADVGAGRAPGFGITIDIINGGRECGVPADASVNDRIRFFRYFVAQLGTSEGANVDCSGMQPF